MNRVSKVTIGMPTFNRAKSLRKAIEQVLAQTFSDFEFIIYNDGSTDDTVNVINSFSDTRIVFINEINKGIPHPLNGILNFARGEYIIILHDHDKFSPQLIEKSVRALDEHPEAGFVLQGCAWINSDETTGYQVFNLELPLINNGRNFGEQLLLNKAGFNSPIHACCMVRNSAYVKVGKYYDEKFGFNSDIDLWFRLLRNYDFIYLRELLFTFTGREHNHIMSKSSWEIVDWLYSTHKKHIPIFLTDETSNAAENILMLKRKRLAKQIFRHSLVSGDNKYLQKSIDYLSKDSNSSLMTKLLVNTLSIEIFQKVTLRVGTLIYSFKKTIDR